MAYRMSQTESQSKPGGLDIRYFKRSFLKDSFSRIGPIIFGMLEITPSVNLTCLMYPLTMS